MNKKEFGIMLLILLIIITSLAFIQNKVFADNTIEGVYILSINEFTEKPEEYKGLIPWKSPNTLIAWDNFNKNIIHIRTKDYGTYTTNLRLISKRETGAELYEYIVNDKNKRKKSVYYIIRNINENPNIIYMHDTEEYNNRFIKWVRIN